VDQRAEKDELKDEHEFFLANHFFNQNLMITHYPEKNKFFNMAISRNGLKDRPTVDSVDVILVHAGESIGGGVREWDYSILRERLYKSSMLTKLREIKNKHDGRSEEIDEVFESYLQLFKDNSVRRTGMGMGMGRVAQFIMGGSEIISF
jgi:aspartyl/asparaginyl-tRNA synthetase